MPIKDYMLREPMMVEPTVSIKKAAKLMTSRHVGCLIILNDRKKGKVPGGILTDRDIVKALSKPEFNSKDSVASIMNENVILCREEDGIHSILRKMNKNGVRRMPVVGKRDQLVGIISAEDILKLLGQELQEISALSDSEIAKEGMKVRKPLRNEITTSNALAS